MGKQQACSKAKMARCIIRGRQYDKSQKMAESSQKSEGKRETDPTRHVALEAHIVLQAIISFRNKAKREDIHLGVFFFLAKRSVSKAFRTFWYAVSVS